MMDADKFPNGEAPEAGASVNTNEAAQPTIVTPSVNAEAAATEAANDLTKGASEQPPQGQPQQPSQNPWTQPANDAAANASARLKAASAPPPNPPTKSPRRMIGEEIHGFAEALAGGSRYRSRYDPDKDEVVREKVPTSGKHLGMAIALEALMGSLAGLGARGPNHFGQSVQRGMAVGQQNTAMQQESDDREDRAAQQQFNNRHAALAANLRARGLAQEIGMRDQKDNQSWIDSHAAFVDNTAKEHPDAVVTPRISEREAKDPEYIKKAMENGWVFVPIGHPVPRFDETTGEHFKRDGIPMYDNEFMVIDAKKLKTTPEELNNWQKWSLRGTIDGEGKPIQTLRGAELLSATRADNNHKVAQLEMEQRDLNDYYAYLNNKGVKGADGKPLEAPNLTDLVRKQPNLSSLITDVWARHFGDDPSHAFSAMTKEDDAGAAKGALMGLYGGKAMLDKYALAKEADKKHTDAEANKDAQYSIIDTPNKATAVLATVGVDGKSTQFTKEQVAAAKSFNDLDLANAKKKHDAVSVNINSGKATQEDYNLAATMLNEPNNISAIKDLVGYRSDEKLKIFTAARRQNPNFNPGLIERKVDFIKQYENPNSRDSMNRAAINNFLQHGADLSDLNSQYGKADIKVLNTPINAMAKEFGSAVYEAYATQMEIVKEEVRYYFANGYAPSKEQQQKYDDLLNDKLPPNAVEGFLKQISHAGIRRLDTENQKFRTVMGADDPNIITPSAVDAMRKLGLAKEVEKYGSGGTLGELFNQKATPSQQGSSHVVPKGAFVGRDAKGNIVGYKTADGKVTKF